MLWPLFSTTKILVILLTLVIIFQIFPILSVPLTDSIALCTHGGLTYGVFGWCQILGPNKFCTKPHIGYAEIYKDASLVLPSSSKFPVSKLLIVHVFALANTTVLWIIVLFINFTDLGRQPRFLLLGAVISLPDFVLSLFSFLVDILLFANHLGWPGWLGFSSVIMIAPVCSMLWSYRRTVSIRNYEALKNEVERISSIEAYSINGLDGVAIQSTHSQSEIAVPKTRFARPGSTYESSILA
ncbi:hypothetical protein KAFR_0A00330 [Kazachstania africana CBS 2517]|uniref:PH-response regulator protein palI/RIM9 n=1 Tax=Kazachstania africana (strain ATCC 22294 / BCRC 22015 / CBS 2517 / CECT 1963 / NBRC 1671 / NRRL Y-8276) TaxID=1071382 RepID=H2AM71_KAZAF|nr:hypothetical protein KAFR_0A00330 [Kazachstania africana CBS 2517]CCF55471.1 hypothetical protein KAFR_0A00330 [Kazachstania africana CBS 2517]